MDERSPVIVGGAYAMVAGGGTTNWPFAFL